MLIETALVLAAMLADPARQPGERIDAVALGRDRIVAPDPVLAEMAPPAGHWEAEDAPAYFSDRQDIAAARAFGGPAGGAPVADASSARRRP